MNHILGFAQLLELDDLSADQQGSLQHILKSGRRLLGLIDRILAVSQSRADNLNFLESNPTAEGTEPLDRDSALATSSSALEK
jgi:signal transduction histidine kinase